ncbi:hypothetical protein OKW76_00915 [Sphingomonas sp. S1-29]|uniref:hypothetical protein n=1 Tax=Sphingomonas sp. S1-29 TaxID=2991074 RepID=UPI00223F19E1|nr:hypothetical protein [Sphingomonas sp. S1-29]UZK69685.1 hypothetical protein OKW76_00915 [Sphingomonas sp. S1-29]
MHAELRREIVRALLIQLGWTTAFVITLSLSIGIVFNMPRLGGWRTAIILLPLFPALGILRFALRQFRKSDEMQRRSQMEAVVWAFGASLVLMIGYTLLEVIGWPRLPMWVPLVVTQSAWIAAIWVQLLRFR